MATHAPVSQGPAAAPDSGTGAAVSRDPLRKAGRSKKGGGDRRGTGDGGGSGSVGNMSGRAGGKNGGGSATAGKGSSESSSRSGKFGGHEPAPPGMLAAPYDSFANVLGSVAPGLMDLPISSLDQQALLQLLSPFLSGKPVTSAGKTIGDAVAPPPNSEAETFRGMVGGDAESAMAMVKAAAAAAVSVSANGGAGVDTNNASENGTVVSTLFKTGLKGESAADRLQAVKAIRALLSAEREDIALSIIDQGLLPNLVKFLDSGEEALQVEALSALTNLVVSQSDHTHFLIGSGVVPVLVNLLRSENDDILEKAVWVLGNIAGDSAVTRDAVLAGGALVPMIRIIESSCASKPKNSTSKVLGDENNSEKKTKSLPSKTRVSSVRGKDEKSEKKSEVHTGDEASLSAKGDEESGVSTTTIVNDGKNDVDGIDVDASGRATSADAGAVTDKIAIVESTAKQTSAKSARNMRLLRVSVWCVSNLCDGPSMLPSFPAKSVISAMIQALAAGTDAEVISHTCWALSHLCDGPSPHVQAVVDANVCSALTELLSHRSWRVVKPALRTIGNIVCAEDELDYTQHIVDHHTIPHLRKLVEHSNREIQKEACWTFSNIAAGTVPQIQCVLDSGAIDPLVTLASSATTDPDVKIEACWVLLNATSCGSDLQIEFLVQHGCVAVLCELLSHPNMLVMAVEGLEKLLQVGDEAACRASGVSKTTDPRCGPNSHAALMDLEKLNECLSMEASSVTNTVTKRVTKILRNYFVSCAICKNRYPSRTTKTKFCNECKCVVCSECNCEVYHLSYQLEQWNDLDSVEKSQASAKAAAKKKKRQKKKQKAKDRKKKGNNNANAKAAVDSNTKGNEPAVVVLSSETKSTNLLSGEERQTTDSSEAGSKKKKKKKKKKKTRDSGQNIVKDTKDLASVSSPASVSALVSPPVRSDGGVGMTAGPEARADADKSEVLSSIPLQRATTEDMDANDKLVSFLSQTGSILELAKMLDGEDDSEEAGDNDDMEWMRKEMEKMKAGK